MKKILITKNNVEDYIENKRLIVTDNLIVSPGVFDLLRNKDIEVIYGDSIGEEDKEKEDNTKDTEKIEKMIKEILEKEYNLVDSTVIGNVSRSVMNALK